MHSDPDGLCLMHSRNPKKDKDAFNSFLNAKFNSNDHNFRGYYFPISLNFNNKTFYNADFSGANFYQEVSLKECNFYGLTQFTGAIFLDCANFSRSNFNGPTDFRFIHFYEQVDFFNSNFSMTTIFLGTTFHNDAYFSFSSFSEKIRFEVSSFLGEANFRGSIIKNKLIFSSINRNEKPFKGDFSILEINDKGLLVFQDLSLAKVRFEGSDLRRIEFHHIQWYLIAVVKLFMTRFC